MTDSIPPTDRKQTRRTFAKSSAIEYQKRVETVRRLILSGMDSAPIVQNVTEMWGVTERQARKYMMVARQKNQAYHDFIEAEMFAEHIAIRRDIRRRAQAAGDMKAELAAARDEAQLIGLYAPTKIAPTTPDGQSEWLSISQLAREMGVTESEARALVEQTATRLAALPESATLLEEIMTGKSQVAQGESD